MENPVRQDAFWVLERAMHISIEREPLQRLAREWTAKNIEVPAWSTELHIEDSNPERLLAYLFLVDTLNFCFWAKYSKDRWRVKFRGKSYSGYAALAVSLKKFFEETAPNSSAAEILGYFVDIPLLEFKDLLGGTGKLLLLEERRNMVSLTARALLKKYDGSPLRFVESVGGSASAFVEKVRSEISHFNDVAMYSGRQVRFLKRAQILAVDIYKAFDGKGPGRFGDMDWITLMADYRLPQYLRAIGCLRYSPELAWKIDRGVELPAGSPEEVEIRAATVVAGEYLREELSVLGKSFRCFEIDTLLWHASKTLPSDSRHHLTRTIYY